MLSALGEWSRRAPIDPAFQSIVANALKSLRDRSALLDIKLQLQIVSHQTRRTSGCLYGQPELSCMEFDESPHPFSMSSQTGNLLYEVFKGSILDVDL